MAGLSEERIQGHVVLDVLGDALASRGGDLFEVTGGEGEASDFLSQVSLRKSSTNSDTGLTPVTSR